MAIAAIGKAELTARQKAAIIVRLILAEGEDMDLARLPSGLQTDLAQEMALMGLIDRDTRNAVIAEFCDTLESIGLSFPGDIDGTLELLDGHLSPDTTDRLRRMAALNGGGDPWDRIAALSTPLLAELARTEAVEIAAVMFSKLPVPRAAEVFGLLDPALARQIAYAMSLTGMIEAQALRRIDPRDIARITREVENSVLVKAMAGAKGPNQPTVDFLLSGLSSRLADSMREEMEGLGKVSTRDAEEAMDQVVAAIRRMEAAGDLFMIAAEPDEDEAAVA